MTEVENQPSRFRKPRSFFEKTKYTTLAQVEKQWAQRTARNRKGDTYRHRISIFSAGAVWLFYCT